MLSLTHGSQDSLDLDRVYFFPHKPTLQECHRFCAQTEENRNIAILSPDGVIQDCFKGLPDELNNGLLRTAPLHPQQHPIPIRRAVLRLAPLKTARAIRLILTRLTRTPHRAAVKAALSSLDLPQRIQALQAIDLTSLSLSPDTYKSIAFQVAQSLALMDNHELYTKQEIAQHYPHLRPLLYRASEPQAALHHLNDLRDHWLHRLQGLHITPFGHAALLHSPHPRDHFHHQCQGLLLDLKVERLLCWPPPNATTTLCLHQGQPHLATHTTLTPWTPPAHLLALLPRHHCGLSSTHTPIACRDSLTGEVTPAPSP